MPTGLFLIAALATAGADPTVLPAPAPPRDWSALPQIQGRAAPPWSWAEPGLVAPRDLGCATRTPGLPVTPPCRVALEAIFGPAAVGPARPAAR
jgi:hypothetical protein